MNLAEAGANLAGDLLEFLAAHPGESPVFLELKRPGDFVARLRLDRQRGVKVDQEVVQGLRALCGESAILVEKQG